MFSPCGSVKKLATFVIILSCVIVQTSGYSTYIEPYFPPNGAYSFSSHGEYWSIPSAVISSICMILGVYYASLGYKFWNINLWGVGFLTIFTVVFFLMNSYNLDIWWFNAIIAIVIGSLFSWILYCFKKSLYFVLGFNCGFLLSVQLIGGFIPLVWNPSYLIIILWCFSIFFGICYGVLSTYLTLQPNMQQKYISIFNTSIFGGYLFIIGLDYFSEDGYAAILPSMFDGDIVLIYPWFVSLVFLMVWILMSVFGAGIQRMIISSRTFYYKPKSNIDYV